MWPQHKKWSQHRDYLFDDKQQFKVRTPKLSIPWTKTKSFEGFRPPMLELWEGCSGFQVFSAKTPELSCDKRSSINLQVTVSPLKSCLHLSLLPHLHLPFFSSLSQSFILSRSASRNCIFCRVKRSCLDFKKLRFTFRCVMFKCKTTSCVCSLFLLFWTDFLRIKDAWSDD